MAKLKFKDENNEFIPVVQDVKVNGSSVFDEKDANIRLKTINSQSIVGYGNINIQGGEGEYVKYSPNQGLTNQQKTNARNNIDAVGNGQVKQQTGTSTTDVMSQKGVTDALATKQDAKPDGRTNLIARDTGKLDLKYMPATVLGGITNGGTFNESGIIKASSYAPELEGRNITSVQFASYPSYYFIYSGPSQEVWFFNYQFSVGDWAISLGNGWAKLNATDAVTSVNGKMGQVYLTPDDLDCVYKYWGTDNGNKNLVTNEYGEVIISDYALGQIIVDVYSELPNATPESPHQNIPERARATVLQPEDLYNSYTQLELQDSYDTGEPLAHEIKIYWAPERPNASPQYVSLGDDYNSYYAYYDDQISPDPCFWIEYYDEQTGNPAWFTFSWAENGQPFLLDPELKTTLLYDVWTKVTYDVDNDTFSAEQANWSDLPTLNSPAYVYEYEVEKYDPFTNAFIWVETKLSGEYTYFEVTPETDPPTYYWGYTPSNVQADWAEQDPSALSFVLNKPYLNTTRTTSLSTNSQEEIVGTISLHKISKTGAYSDLINPVGKLSTSGEIFNNYTGAFANLADGLYSHAEGYNVAVRADYAHGEGQNHDLQSTATAAHAEGKQHTVKGTYSHAEGQQNTTNGSCSHAEGNYTTAGGSNSHAEGQSTSASGICTHAEGYATSAGGDYSHTEGYSTRTSADYCHAEGYQSVAGGQYAHAEGYHTVASGQYTHAEGYETAALSYGAHSEGLSTSAVSNYSHAEGQETQARGIAAHAGGRASIANRNYSFATGYSCYANSESQAVVGAYNVIDNADENMFIVGAGYVDSQTQNIVYRNGLVVRKDANIWTPGEIKVGGTDYSTGSTFVEKQSNKVTTIDANSTNDQYPTAKCVYDIVGDIESLLQGV